MADPLERDIEALVEQLGFEVVEIERAGSKKRPLLQLRIDRMAAAAEAVGDAQAEAGAGVTLEDCGRVSRAVEAYLDERPDVPERYVLEVSSPGVERPLVRRRDFERFRGRTVAVQGKAPLYRGSKRVEGELLGIEGEEGGGLVRLRTSDGADLAIARELTKRINLVYRWGGEGRGG
jgi:ribosome maturation factor RimP